MSKNHNNNNNAKWFKNLNNESAINDVEPEETSEDITENTDNKTALETGIEMHQIIDDVANAEINPNFGIWDIEDADNVNALATIKGWKVATVIGLFGVTDGIDKLVAYEDITQMPEELANVITKIEQAMPGAIKTPQTKTEHEKKGKTQGVFEITSVFNPDFSLRGSSSQIEICTRDYMNWCIKNKAPKTMQAEYDRAVKENGETEPKNIFKVTILKVSDDLKAAKEEFGLTNKGGKPQAGNQDADKILSPEEALSAIGTIEGINTEESEAETEEAQETE